MVPTVLIIYSVFEIILENLGRHDWHINFYIIPVLQLQEDKIRALQEKVELSEQKLAQYAKLPDVEQELKQRMEALHQVRNTRRYKTFIPFT